MATSKMGRTRGVLTAGLATLVAASALFGGAAAANAAPSNIDENEPRSLTLHKFEQPAVVGEITDGTAQDTTGLVPMEGVSFSATQVDAYDGDSIDLTTMEGWAAVPELGSFDPANATFGSVSEAESNAAGAAEFGSMDLGLYWVQELAAPNHNVANAMKPFLVTLPMAGPTAGQWIYDVHAYPKNSVTDAEKSVNDSSAWGLGDDVTWSIRAGIPLMGDDNLTTFSIVDSLPAEVSYQSATVTAETAAGLNVDLDAGDYTIDHVAGVVTLTFTATGLTKLEGAQGGEVVLNTVTSVDEIGDGTIVNNAVVTVNDAVMDVDATTTWGAARIDKVVTGTESPLAGAEFQIFLTEADAIAQENAVEVNGGDTFVTLDPNGEAMIDGLKAASTGTVYWLVETKAPAGYLIDSTPQSFTVVPGDIATPVVIQMDNEQAPESILPQLGATGQSVAIVTGSLLAAGALLLGGTALMRRGQKQA